MTADTVPADVTVVEERTLPAHGVMTHRTIIRTDYVIHRLSDTITAIVTGFAGTNGFGMVHKRDGRPTRRGVAGFTHIAGLQVIAWLVRRCDKAGAIVTGGTFSRRTFEDATDMTAVTGDRLTHAVKIETRCEVIKIGGLAECNVRTEQTDSNQASAQAQSDTTFHTSLL